MANTGLAVVESRWWGSGNDSVQPLFATLSGIVEDNPFSVRYDMFAEENSLHGIIDGLAKDGGFHSIYVAAHGNENAIFGLGDVEISRTKLRNMFRELNKKGIIKGVYFGSCQIGRRENAAFWLTEKPKTGLQWVSGYSKNVDWIDSSAVDMIFGLSIYMSAKGTDQGRIIRRMRCKW